MHVLTSDIWLCREPCSIDCNNASDGMAVCSWWWEKHFNPLNWAMVSTDSSGSHACRTYNLNTRTMSYINLRDVCSGILYVSGRLHKSSQNCVHHTSNMRDIVGRACIPSGLGIWSSHLSSCRDGKAVCMFLYVYLSDCHDPPSQSWFCKFV